MPKIVQAPTEYRSKQWLYQKYIVERLSSQKIADFVGCGRKTLDQWLAKVKIVKRGFGGSKGKKSKEWLIKEYIVKGKTLGILAKELEVDPKVIHRWLIDYNIPRHKTGAYYTGKEHHWWNGGEHLNGSGPTKGYTTVYIPSHPHSMYNGCVWKHRIVVENYIGRYLNKEEVIHHINFSRSDNRIKNLYLFPTHKEHMLWHRAFLRNKKIGFLKSNLSKG